MGRDVPHFVIDRRKIGTGAEITASTFEMSIRHALRGPQKIARAIEEDGDAGDRDGKECGQNGQERDVYFALVNGASKADIKHADAFP